MNIISSKDNPDAHLPDATVGDTAYAVAKAAVSALPFVGGPAAELVALVLAPPVTKRRDEWLDSLARRLCDLEAKVEGFKVESLKDNEAFVSAMMQVTQAALQTHQKEELEVLRNALLNVALGRGPNETVQRILLSLLGRIAPLHVQVLQLYEQAFTYGTEKSVDLQFDSNEFRWVREQEGLCALAIKNLADYGLVTGGGFGGTARISWLPFAEGFTLEGQITGIGQEFLALIGAPNGLVECPDGESGSTCE